MNYVRPFPPRPIMIAPTGNIAPGGLPASSGHLPGRCNKVRYVRSYGRGTLNVHLVGNILEEVMLQYSRQANEQLRVHRLAVEYVVDVVAPAAQLPCKPGYGVRPWVPVELGLYHFSNVNHTFGLLASCQTVPVWLFALRTWEKRRTMFSLSYPRHRQTPFLK